MLPNNFLTLIPLILSPYPLRRIELSMKTNVASTPLHINVKDIITRSSQETPVAKDIKLHCPHAAF